jgi:predicted RNA-binding Zn ribbon-like protein
MLSVVKEISSAAPGRLELVRRFVNSRNIETGDEAFDTAAGATDWLRAADLLPAGTEATAADVARTVEVREALRELLLANHGPDAAPDDAVAVLNRALRRAGQSVAFTTTRGWITEPTAPAVDAAIGRLLGVVVQAMADGSWPRLKACVNDECQWAFYDRSRARSGKWCQMGVCGNRAKQRAWRTRHPGS